MTTNVRVHRLLTSTADFHRYMARGSPLYGEQKTDRYRYQHQPRQLSKTIKQGTSTRLTEQQLTTNRAMSRVRTRNVVASSAAGRSPLALAPGVPTPCL